MHYHLISPIVFFPFFSRFIWLILVCNRWWSRIIVLSSSVIITQQNHHLSAEEIALLLIVFFLFLPVFDLVIWLAANETSRMNWNAMWYLMPGLSHGLASRKSGRQRWAGSLRHWLLCNNELPVTIPPRHLLVFYHPFLFDRSMNWVGLTSCLLSSSRLEKEWDEQSNLCRRILIKNHKMRWATQHGWWSDLKSVWLSNHFRLESCAWPDFYLLFILYEILFDTWKNNVIRLVEYFF